MVAVAAEACVQMTLPASSDSPTCLTSSSDALSMLDFCESEMCIAFHGAKLNDIGPQLPCHNPLIVDIDTKPRQVRHIAKK